MEEAFKKGGILVDIHLFHLGTKMLCQRFYEKIGRVISVLFRKILQS